MARADDIKSNIAGVRKLIADLHDQLDKETDATEKKKLRQRIDDSHSKIFDLDRELRSVLTGTTSKTELYGKNQLLSWEQELELLISRLPHITDENKRNEVTARVQELASAIGGGKPVAKGRVSEQNIPALEKAREALKTSPTPTKKPEISDQDKKLLAAIKGAGKPLREPVLRVGNFKLPQFTTDTSTGIVLACILIIFGLELDAGTKFVQLWNDAFSPHNTSAETSASQTSANQDHGNANAATSTEATLVAETQAIGQSVEAFTTGVHTSGGGTFYDYGVPDTFHFLDGVIW